MKCHHKYPDSLGTDPNQNFIKKKINQKSFNISFNTVQQHKIFFNLTDSKAWSLNTFFLGRIFVTQLFLVFDNNETLHKALNQIILIQIYQIKNNPK